LRYSLFKQNQQKQVFEVFPFQAKPTKTSF